MSMLPMALGTCRDSGCSLIFLDSGKLWAFAAFSTSFFPVRKHQGQRDPRSQNVYAGDSRIHSHKVGYPIVFQIHTRLPRICTILAVLLTTSPGPSLNPHPFCGYPLLWDGI